MQNHTHVTDIGSFTSGAGSAHVHAAGGLYFQVAELVNSGGSRYMYFNSNTSSPASWVQVQRTDNNGVGDGTSTGTKFIDGYPSAGQTTNYYTANGSGASSSEASHTHTIDPPSTGSGGPSNNTTTAGGTGSTSGASAYSHSHGFTPAGTVSQPSFTGSAGTTASGNPPFLVVNYIIKY
jgi:hypothetical protein